MPTEKTPPIDRLRRKVWIRALRIEIHRSLLAQGVHGGIAMWADLERRLLKTYNGATVGGRLQGILGVVRYGNDPRRIMRRIRDDDLEGKIPTGAKQVRRTASGRKPPDGRRKKHLYWEVPIDLVAAGENLCPWSSKWEWAYLWTLTYPQLPRLEDIRSTITELKHNVGLVSPTVDMYRGYLSDDEFNAISRRSPQEQEGHYVDSMNSLVTNPTADSLSLLAALVAESYITDQHQLLNLHRDAFFEGVNNLLANPHMADIAKEFMNGAANTILGTKWRFPGTYHVSSLSEPFITLEKWEAIVRENSLGMLIPLVLR